MTATDDALARQLLIIEGALTASLEILRERMTAEDMHRGLDPLPAEAAFGGAQPRARECKHRDKEVMTTFRGETWRCRECGYSPEGNG